jgi:hypothetical protein
MSTATAAATEAEELARCSEATIIRVVEKRGLETTTGPGGRVMVRLADLIRIGRIKPEDLPTGATGAGTAELRRTQDLLVAAQRELGEVRGRLAERDTVVATLTGQVTEKDRQIRKLTEIIDNLGLALREKAAR